MLRKFGCICLALLMTNCSSEPHRFSNEPHTPPNSRKIAIEDFFRNPEVTDFQISSDGRWVAYRKTYQGRLNLFIRRSTEVTGEKRITNFSDRDIPGFTWKGSQYLVFWKDKGGDENYHTYVADILTGKLVDITPWDKVRSQVVDLLDESSDENILIAHNKRDPKAFDLFKLHLPTGRLTLLEKNPGNMTSWMADHAGRVRWAEGTDGANTNYFYRSSDKIPFKKILTASFRDKLDGIYFTADNSKVLALSNFERDKISLVEFDPNSKKETEILYQNAHYDLSSAEYSIKHQKITTASFHSWHKERVFFDLETEKAFRAIGAQLPDMDFDVVSKTRDESVMVVKAFSDRNPASYYLYRVKGEQLVHLADTMPWLKADQLSSMQNVEFTARDGLKLQGYMMLPAGKKPKNLSFVINPHGGPWARDLWGFDPVAQFLANRGYGIFKVNFRGSTGFGKKFWTSSFKQWGRAMQDDITDGVRWLIKNDYASSSRLCIFGASYGGFATLSGLIVTPDLYRCGIDYVGVSNIFTLYKSIPPYWEPQRQMFYEMVGDPEKDKELLTAISPVFHADKIKAALFVIQGANDPRVIKAESDQIVEALKKRGIDVPYLVKDNEGHGFRNEENRMELYRAIEKFLGKYL